MISGPTYYLELGRWAHCLVSKELPQPGRRPQSANRPIGGAVSIPFLVRRLSVALHVLVKNGKPRRHLQNYYN